MIGFLKKLFLLVLLGALILSGVYVVKKLAPPRDTAQPIVGNVTRADLVQKISFAGVVVAKRRSIIAAPYTGYIKELHVRVGDTVKKGDPLVTISASLDSLEPVFPMRSPLAGLVTLIRKEEGEFVKENDSTDYVLRVDDVSKFFVEAKVPEIDRTKVENGLKAVVKISAISNVVLHGVVKRIALAPDEKQQGFTFGGKSQIEYQVLIELTEHDDRIRTGMSAIIDVIAASLPNVLTLGHEFVQGEEGHYFVILKDGSKRDIKIGLRNEEAVEITEGVNEGDEVRQIEFAP